MTNAPRVPGQPVLAGRPGAAGSPMAGQPYRKLDVAPRGPSASKQLVIDWTFPVHVPPQAEATEAGSRALVERRALEREQAFADIAGDDPRPLLVLRECLTCTGTDDALLTREADNEKTMLMSRWFHCVKLPPDVLEPSHPYHALFTGDDPAHLFVSSTTGDELLALDGAQSRTELWQVLETALDGHYVTKHERSLKGLLKVLDEMDALDMKAHVARQRLDAEIEKRGPKSPKVRRIRKDLDKLAASREELEAEARELSALVPREPQEPAQDEA